MAIEIPKDRSITGDEARQAFIYGLEKVLKQKVDPSSVMVRSDDAPECVRITGTNFEIQCVVTGESAKKPRAPRTAKAAV
jgi:hypothetical protein